MPKRPRHHLLARSQTGLPAGTDAADRTWQSHDHAGVDGNSVRQEINVGRGEVFRTPTFF